MNIRDIINNKRSEINNNMNGDCAIGVNYFDNIILENADIFEYDIIEESIGSRLKDIKDKAIATIKKMWKAIRNFILKITYHFGLLFTSSDQLIKAVGDDMTAVFIELGRKINVNSCVYRYDPTLFDQELQTLLHDCDEIIQSWDVKSFNKSDADFLYSAFGVYRVNKLEVVDDRGNINIENVKTMARQLIIRDPEVRLRKLIECIDYKSFTYALKGKSDIKAVKKSIKSVDKTFKNVIKDFETQRDDYGDTDDDTDTTSSDVKKFFDGKIQCTSTMCKIITTYLKAYLNELKKLYRFIKASVKKLARKTDPTLIYEENQKKKKK